MVVGVGGSGCLGCGAGRRGCHTVSVAVRWLCHLVVVGGGWWSWVGVRSWFENCIVDASIFVAKLLRAHGGCLGTRSR